jgi:hypothetical protein
MDSGCTGGRLFRLHQANVGTATGRGERRLAVTFAVRSALLIGSF